MLSHLYIYIFFYIYIYIYIYFIYWTESFQVTRNNVTVQTESMELSVDKQDVSVQFNYLILSDGTTIS